MKTIDDLGDLRGRRVLVRADLNVPLDDDGDIADDGRIRASVPTVTALADRGARVVVCSHLGRPKGVDPKASLRPVAGRLGERLNRPVAFATDVVGESARTIVTTGLADGAVALLENLRFEPGETSKDEAERAAFADKLAALAERYVGDGFGAMHRKHASVYDVPQRLPHAAGYLVLREVEVLCQLTEDPARPYVLVLGGAKVSDKLAVIDNLMRTADRILIGGGMMFTFLAAQGQEIGKSLLEADQVDTVRDYLTEAKERGVDLVLPVDVVAATEFSADAPHDVYPVDSMPADRIGLDIGPETAALFEKKLADAKTVFWNGPMGVFELAPYAAGTRRVAEALTRVDGVTVVGGGDSAAAVRALGFDEELFGHISTGGGASLEYLEGKTLPGLAVLAD